jgi:hypothetical protein
MIPEFHISDIFQCSSSASKPEQEILVFKESYYKGEPDHAAATHHVFMYYMLMWINVNEMTT